MPGDWQTRRRRILRRDPVCCICGNALATEVDHINPGDDHSDSNLRGVCRRCHLKKSSREGNRARGARVDRR